MYSARRPQAGVYKIRNTVDGKVYVGGTKNLGARKLHHFADLRRKKHHSHRFQFAYDQYGREAFVFEVIQTLSPSDDIHAVEQKYIDSYKSADPEFGYNIAPNADDTTGVPCSEKKKVLIGNANRGLKRTPEHIKIMSECTRQRNLNASPELRKKWSEAQRVRNSTPEGRERARSMGLQNRKISHEIIEEMKQMRKNGVRVFDIAKKFDVNYTYVYTLIKNKSEVENALA
jgi:group I intron endonuclease